MKDDAESKLCECGCGMELPPKRPGRKPSRFLRDHHFKVQKQREETSKRMEGNKYGEGAIFTEERRRKIGIANTGQIRTDEQRQNMKGEKNSRWNGRRWQCQVTGYIFIYSPEHPYANKSYVPEHRLIIEEMIGRYLTIEEKVHHINGIKDDNRVENLQIVTETEHALIHKFWESRSNFKG